MKPATAAIVLGTAAFAGAVGGNAVAESGNSPSVAKALEAPAAAAVSRSGAHSSLADMVEAVSPSVVQIDATGQARAVATPYGLMRTPARQSMGSGFIVDASGLVITNNHVVDGAAKVKVKLHDGTERSARVLGRDPKTDIAVLRIEGGGRFQPVSWGDSDRIRVGESVFAVGSPFGLGNSVTAGIVSARSREIGAGPYDDFLQVDAAINSGNSGGPLFDANGRVIGVNTAIVSPSGGNVGIGFAIPSRLAKNIATQIAQNGTVSRGHLGVALQDLNPDLTAALGLKASKGALIGRVEPGSPAAASGLQPGDVVREFAGRPIEDSGDLARLVAESRAGSTVPVRIVRDGRELALSLRIGSGA